ncbi:MAG TPA: hypothetical protein PLM75_03300, partial [bacterium]|nr:hypothetical protein [bacterium]
MKKNILIVLILTFAVTQILHAKSFKNFYYGERVNMNKNLNNGIMQSIYILENHNFISIGFDYSLTNEERSRDFYNNYNDWSGRNVYASQKNNYFSLNHILAQYNKFGVSYEKEQDCDYSFTEKIFDLNNNLLKTNARQSDGDIYSLNLFYTFTFNLSTKYNFKIQPLVSYKKFENKILMFEDFQSVSFDDYKLCGYFDGDGISSKCSINFESQNKKNKYILSYQFPTRFSGDYYISDNTTGNSVSISTKKITMPAELGITAILIMPSEHFTKLIFNIIYTNWQNLKDNEGFQISSAPQNLKN